MNLFMKLFWHQLFIQVLLLLLSCSIYSIFLLLFSLLFSSFLVFSFLFLFIFLLLPFWFSLLPTLLQTPCHLHFFHSAISLRVITYKPWHSKFHTLLLSSNSIDLCSFPVSLVINVHFYHMLNRFLLVEKTNHIPYINWSFYFFQLILSNSIFAITSLNMFSLPRLQ